MDPTFKQWLAARNAPPKLLKRLEKEDIWNQTTLSDMTDSDLEALQKKHKLPMGHVVILRSGRDELRKGSAKVPSSVDDEYDIIERPSVETETPQSSATAPLLSQPSAAYPARFKPRQRPSGNDIRSKYQLPVRGGQRTAAAPRNGASAVPSATPSPHPDTARTPTPAAGGGLPAAAMMQDLHRRGVERGEKIAVLEQKSRGLASTAMDYESICAQLADKEKHKKKKKKKQKKKDEPEVQETHETRKVLSSQSSPARGQQQNLSASIPHTFTHHRHPSPQSPTHGPSTFPGAQSDPIRQRTPHTVPSYGTMDEDRPRPTTPTSYSYTSDDEKLHLHYDEEEEEEEKEQSTTRGARKLCSCCRTM